MSWVLLDSKLWSLQILLLMLSVFTVFMGYGITLPVLPFLLESRLGSQAVFSIALHTGLITGVFMFTLFAFAPFWGKMSDRIGRRPVILIGLGGCVVALMIFGFVENLWLAYLTRAVGGAVVSAVLPVALAYISDISSWQLRAQRFALVSASATLGFLIGPVIGGLLTVPTLSFTSVSIDSTSLPFIVSSISGSLVWIIVYLGLSKPDKSSKPTMLFSNKHRTAVIPMNSLLALALVGMFGLGSFEVGVALQGQQVLNLNPFQIGMLFLECSLMMVVVQILLFELLVRNFSFKQIIVYALLTMALGLGLFPVVTDFWFAMLAASFVGLGSGVLIPILAYQTSLDAKVPQGAALGKQSAAGSLGQGLGSVLAGGLFGIVSQSPFWITAVILMIAAFFGLGFRNKYPK